jgi:hypothetical protein
VFEDGRLAGVLWAMLVLCKLLPLSLLVVLLVWRRWRVFQSAAIVVVLYMLLLTLTGRLGEEWYLYRRVLPEIGFYWRYISMAAARALLVAAQAWHWHDNAALYRGFSIAILMLLAGMECLGLLWMRRRGIAFERALELALLMIPLLSPLLEYRHFILYLPVLMLHLRRWAQGEMRRGIAAAYLTGWMVLAQSICWLDFWPDNPLIFQFAPLGAAMLLVGTLIAETSGAPRGQSASNIIA